MDKQQLDQHDNQVREDLLEDLDINNLIERGVNSFITCKGEDKEIILDEDIVPMKRHLKETIKEQVASKYGIE